MSANERTKMPAKVACLMKPVTDQFQFGPWILTSTKSHILESEGPAREGFEKDLKLPQVPEMIFADNILRIEHSAGFGIEFNALDALRLVDAEQDLVKVAVTQAWREARAECEHINEVVKPFDWTFTTDYKGTLFGGEKTQLKVSETSERIDLEKLKSREKIHFYTDLLLFEDELADHGASMISIKIRVMPNSFFALLRFYLRVDHVLVRVNDTRLYHEAGQDFMLREYTSRENKYEDLKVPVSVIQDANQISQHLSLTTELYEKLEFPTSAEGT